MIVPFVPTLASQFPVRRSRPAKARSAIWAGAPGVKKANASSSAENRILQSNPPLPSKAGQNGTATIIAVVVGDSYRASGGGTAEAKAAAVRVARSTPEIGSKHWAVLQFRRRPADFRGTPFLFTEFDDPGMRVARCQILQGGEKRT